MKNMTRQMTLLLASTLLFSAQAMAEDVYGSVNKLSLTTIDLTPGDGQAAGVRVQSYNTTLHSTYSNGSNHVRGRSGLGGASSGSLELQNGDLYTSVHYGRSNGNLGAFAFSFTDFGDSLDGGESVNLTAEYFVRMKVAPYSMITLSGAYWYSAVQSADFTAYGSAFGTLADVTGQSSNWSLSTDVNAAQPFALGYVNNTAREVDVYLELRSSFGMRGTYDVAQVSPVPEPSGYLMLGGGLALLGTLARRRSPAANHA